MDEKYRKIDPVLPERLGGNLKTLEYIYRSSFAGLKKADLTEISVKSGASLHEERNIILRYFSRYIKIDTAAEKVNYQDSGREVDMFNAVIILHYITTADGEPISGKWISYRELPDGMFYFRTIPGVLEPLLVKYEDSLELLLEKAHKYGAIKSRDFKNGIVIYPFPYFPVMLVLEEKTEEFSADLRVLFDSSASHYIKTDIIKVLLVNIVKLLTD